MLSKMVYFMANPDKTGISTLLFLQVIFRSTRQSMDVLLTFTRKTVPAGIFITSLLFGICLTGHAASVNPQTFETLDKRFQHFSRDFYKQVVSQSILPLDKYKTIAELKNKVDVYISSNKPIYAIALIHHNRNTLRDDIDALEVIPLTSLLLEYNDWHEAKRIFDIATVEAGKSAVSKLSFEFAKYFMKRKKWQKAHEYLDDIINELSLENANYARIMIGTILQHQKNHREAVKYYKKVEPSSKYYSTAVLNIAVAYIRQDWWTDALILINETIEKHSSQVSKVMADRLNLVLGYALLRKTYFRNSRDAFRNISLNSPYTNKALLGIALTAANQDDFIGSLNAISILKDKKTTDLSVDESYLLLAYTYGKLKQYLTASSAYSGAIQYYQERIASLQEITHSGNNLLSMVKIYHKDQMIHIKSNDLDYSRQYPGSFFENYANLMGFSEVTGNIVKTNKQYRTLVADYKNTLKNITLQLVSQRTEYLQSYLNQSRYGLARLYDSSLISAN